MNPINTNFLMKIPRLATTLPRVLLVATSAALLAACGTPSPPKPSRSAKVGPKPVSVKPDGLRSWTATSSAKLALNTFVESAVKSDTPTFIPAAERVAVFSDRVLWTGLPDAPAFTGETIEAHAAAARAWLRGTSHPESGRPVAASPSAPIKEALTYLRANGFKVYIVASGDPTETRLLAQEVYGLSHDQVVGSEIDHAYEVRSGTPVIVRRPDTSRVIAKPAALYRAVGLRPVIAFGASDDDFQLLEYATLQNPRSNAAFVLRSGDGARLLSAAPSRGWQIVDPATDWTRNFSR